MVNVTGLKSIKRTFNGHTYEIKERTNTKYYATQVAKLLRKTHHVRIVKLAPSYTGNRASYGVYAKKK